MIELTLAMMTAYGLIAGMATLKARKTKDESA